MRLCLLDGSAYLFHWLEHLLGYGFLLAFC
jgi:hypothetical protein